MIGCIVYRLKNVNLKPNIASSTSGISSSFWKRIVAKGIVAVGRLATGVFALGHASLGIIAIGQLGIGILLGLGQASTGVVAVGQVAIGFIFGLGQLATGFIAIGQVGIGKYVLAQIGFGEHVWSQKVVDPEAVRFFKSWASRIVGRRSQVQSSPFRVTFLPVRRTQTSLSLILLVGWLRPSRRTAGGFSFSSKPLNPEPVNG